MIVSNCPTSHRCLWNVQCKNILASFLCKPVWIISKDEFSNDIHQMYSILISIVVICCVTLYYLQGFLIAICSIVMATFSTGIDSQSFQVNTFSVYSICSKNELYQPYLVAKKMAEKTKFRHNVIVLSHWKTKIACNLI